MIGVAILVGLWQLNTARQTATDVFERRLLLAAMAVANDVAISGGDALSTPTRDILADTSGGIVYYHVYAPDGVIVAGYATPPVGIPRPSREAAGPTFFEATYLGNPVSGVRLQSRTQIEEFSGVFTTTVWQDMAVRQSFVNFLLIRSLLAIAGLIVALMLIVWFGVRLGLHPLTELQSAIASRNSRDLGPIQRSVPIEVAGIVNVLNRLFAQVTHSMQAQSQFISNAAHQLKNPISGVLSLAEAVATAPDKEAARNRSLDLLKAARETAQLSEKLLLLERATSISPISAMKPFNFDRAFSAWAAATKDLNHNNIKIDFDLENQIGDVVGDETMIHELVRNLVGNALQHGGQHLTTINVTALHDKDHVKIRIADDGVGLRHEDLSSARERFRTVGSSSGTGLGVPIVEAIAQGHNGTLKLKSGKVGLIAEVALPILLPPTLTIS
ncbi:MAG: sensor histidine kinase [Pseudomonadota bacterium]